VLERLVAGDVAEIEKQGYTVIRDLLPPDHVVKMREVLAPYLRREYLGRNNFEGHETERVYSLVAVDPCFADLVEHPRILAICDRFLEPNYLLTASQAIKIHPGETPQSFHTDDGFYRIARPRRAVSVSTIWAVDDFTAENGATQIVPGSHTWGDPEIMEQLKGIDFTTEKGGKPREEQADAFDAKLRDKVQDVTMPSGSVIVFLGTLLHRGGANRSARPRLALSNQYCEPWARPQENYFLSIPRSKSIAMSERVQALLGYSVHPPFMGHVRGYHPRRWLLEGKE
jgi:ectoine hydroxylase-related dioxygenase (phytanoyl-CoA dioxygenase family)